VTDPQTPLDPAGAPPAPPDGYHHPVNRWLRFAFLAVAAVVIAELVVRDREGPSKPAFDVDAAVAPDAPALALPTLQGRTVDLASLRGRVVAVNFWATWCGPCLMEMPGLAALWRSHHDRCFDLVGVASDSPRADTERAAGSIPYPVLLDEEGKAVTAWDVRGFPRTFVVDAAGRVRNVFDGAVDEKVLARAIEPLLPESCPGAP
jgi:cytochrome c biogenesis protein CcmG/thiol:disulfide interchange protein DsbE